LLFRNVVGRGISLLAKFEKLLGSEIKERTRTEKKLSWRKANPPMRSAGVLNVREAYWRTP